MKKMSLKSKFCLLMVGLLIGAGIEIYTGVFSIPVNYIDRAIHDDKENCTVVGVSPAGNPIYTCP